MPKRDDLFTQFGKYYGLAFLIPCSILVGYAIGYGLDKWFGTTYLKLVFLLLGIASGMIELIRELNKGDTGK
jgi:F0F1-type ATP synthase assembly protein I